jgi:predicted nucleotidyltransferase
MVALNKIHACARQVAEEFRSEKIVLFGSYAHGKPTDDSDIDLLVVMDHEGRAVEQAAKIRSSIHSTFPVDVLVRSPRKICERLEMGDPFVKTIVEKGEVLYETTHA